MSDVESEFQLQEQRRLNAEERKKLLKLGIPLSDSVEALLEEIAVNYRDNVLLKEYVMREHEAVQAVMRGFEASHRQLEKTVKEQDLSVDELRSQLEDLRQQLGRLEDNFNLFANSLLKQGSERLELVKHAVSVLETELTR